jgi:small subunit ribosomal protein S17
MSNGSIKDNAMEKAVKNKKLFVGHVVSDKMNKTITVRVDRTVRHPYYGKTMRVSKKYKVHDEQRIAKIGDVVEFHTSRPLSKTKHMTLHRVVPTNNQEAK